SFLKRSYQTEDIYEGAGVALRIGELYLKGGNRHIFQKMLVDNVKRSLKEREDVRVVPSKGRIFVVGSSDDDILYRLRWVFGISSVSPVIFCKKDIAEITAHAVSFAKQYPGNEKTVFRISARRSDKHFSHTSSEIGIEVGSAVNVATGYGVNLEDPDLNIGVEVGHTWCFVWTEKLKGSGGLPVGSSGRMALLLSGGIDSPVAGHLLQKRGIALTGVYFHAFPYTPDGSKLKVIDLAKVLAKRQKRFRLYVVQFAQMQEAMQEAATSDYLVLMYRRAMIRIAERLAQKDGIKALATGENLGQVASQTLENMALVEDAAELPIFRPLLTMDKIETMDLAKEIGTYDISILPFEDCCTLFVPEHPQTKGSLKVIKRYEKRRDFEDFIEKAVASVEVIEL
ncbi:MAG: tRNA 4-thiouridine(8) synthase ThiI, partial [Deltaproteobacteria bacterium]|nr:tRNA 4-thiouridine(8) synthase ThiI [Deltaproteobacteria bacterium]